jgi:hypothetical protein
VSRIRHSCNTNEDGTFSFENVPAGNILILIQPRFQDGLYPVAITAGNMLDNDNAREDQSIEQQSSIITLMELFSDENNSSENTSGLLQSSRDAFLQAAAFNWGQARFRVRGLDSEHATMMINGW